MSRKLPVLLVPLFLLVVVSTVNAQTSATAVVSTPISATTVTTPSTANATAISIENIQAATDAATKLRLQKQLFDEQKKAAITKAKEEARALVQAKRDEFKLKIQAIKDQAKKTLVERIDSKIAEVNKNQTDKFTEILTQLQGFLDKSKQAAGATIVANVTAAQTAIDTAKAAVEVQAAKTYTMAITDDTSLKLNAGTTVSQFRQDLMTVYKLIINARQAVKKLFPEPAIIKKEATRSAEL